MPVDASRAAATAAAALPVVELDAGPISYRSVGPVDGPVVVFVHGILVDGNLWWDVADRLAQQGYRAITPNLPLGSHRQAMARDADLSPRGVARIVLDFLAALDLDRVTLVGNDTGGAICQFLLDTDATRIDRLVLTNCDTAGNFPPTAIKPLFWVGKLPFVGWALLQPARTTFLRHLIGFGPLVAGPLDPEQTKAWMAPYFHDSAVRRDLRKVFGKIKAKDLDDVTSRLGRYDRPVLVCWGTGDRMFRLAHAKELVAVFPDARLVEIADARTFVSLDQPERLAQEVAAFAPAPLA